MKARMRRNNGHVQLFVPPKQPIHLQQQQQQSFMRQRVEPSALPPHAAAAAIPVSSTPLTNHSRPDLQLAAIAWLTDFIDHTLRCGPSGCQERPRFRVSDPVAPHRNCLKQHGIFISTVNEPQGPSCAVCQDDQEGPGHGRREHQRLAVGNSCNTNNSNGGDGLDQRRQYQLNRKKSQRASVGSKRKRSARSNNQVRKEDEESHWAPADISLNVAFRLLSTAFRVCNNSVRVMIVNSLTQRIFRSGGGGNGRGPRHVGNRTRRATLGLLNERLIRSAHAIVDDFAIVLESNDSLARALALQALAALPSLVAPRLDIVHRLVVGLQSRHGVEVDSATLVLERVCAFSACFADTIVDFVVDAVMETPRLGANAQSTSARAVVPPAAQETQATVQQSSDSSFSHTTSFALSVVQKQRLVALFSTMHGDWATVSKLSRVCRTLILDQRQDVRMVMSAVQSLTRLVLNSRVYLGEHIDFLWQLACSDNALQDGRGRTLNNGSSDHVRALAIRCIEPCLRQHSVYAGANGVAVTAQTWWRELCGMISPSCRSAAWTAHRLDALFVFWSLVKGSDRNSGFSLHEDENSDTSLVRACVQNGVSFLTEVNCVSGAVTRSSSSRADMTAPAIYSNDASLLVCCILMRCCELHPALLTMNDKLVNAVSTCLTTKLRWRLCGSWPKRGSSGSLYMYACVRFMRLAARYRTTKHDQRRMPERLMKKASECLQSLTSELEKCVSAGAASDASSSRLAVTLSKCIARCVHWIPYVSSFQNQFVSVMCSLLDCHETAAPFALAALLRSECSFSARKCILSVLPSGIALYGVRARRSLCIELLVHGCPALAMALLQDKKTSVSLIGVDSSLMLRQRQLWDEGTLAMVKVLATSVFEGEACVSSTTLSDSAAGMKRVEHLFRAANASDEDNFHTAFISTCAMWYESVDRLVMCIPWAQNGDISLEKNVILALGRHGDCFVRLSNKFKSLSHWHPCMSMRSVVMLEDVANVCSFLGALCDAVGHHGVGQACQSAVVPFSATPATTLKSSSPSCEQLRTSMLCASQLRPPSAITRTVHDALDDCGTTNAELALRTLVRCLIRTCLFVPDCFFSKTIHELSLFGPVHVAILRRSESFGVGNRSSVLCARRSGMEMHSIRVFPSLVEGVDGGNVLTDIDTADIKPMVLPQFYFDIPMVVSSTVCVRRDLLPQVSFVKVTAWCSHVPRRLGQGCDVGIGGWRCRASTDVVVLRYSDYSNSGDGNQQNALVNGGGAEEKEMCNVAFEVPLSVRITGLSAKGGERSLLSLSPVHAILHVSLQCEGPANTVWGSALTFKVRVVACFD